MMPQHPAHSIQNLLCVRAEISYGSLQDLSEHCCDLGRRNLLSQGAD